MAAASSGASDFSDAQAKMDANLSLEPRDDRREAGRNWLPAAAVVFITFIVFFPSLHNHFVDWDDELLLTGNMSFRGFDWPRVKWMFTSLLGGVYQPLPWLTYALDHSVWGMNPFGYHLTSLIFHALNAALLYRLALRLFGAARLATGNTPFNLTAAAVFAALAFSIHPLRVESVAWATERRDVVSGFFYLLAVTWYLKSHSGPAAEAAGPWKRLALGAFALSLLSKGVGVTLPVILLVLDVYPLRRLSGWPRTWLGPAHREVLREKLPYFLLALAAGSVGVFGQTRQSMLSLEAHGIAARLAQTVYGLVFYIWKTLLPLRLLPLYEIPFPLDPLSARFVLSGVAVLVISAGLWTLRRRLPAGLAVWVCYGVTLAPVLGIFQFGTQLAADRYSYLSCLGWALLAGAALAAGLRSAVPLGRKLTLAGAAVIILSLCVLTRRQAAVWHDPVSLWRYTLSLEPGHLVAHNNLGLTLVERGDWDEGTALYRAALELRPYYTPTRNNLGAALAGRGRAEAAIEQYRLALAIEPGFADAHYNLGNALSSLGKLTEAAAEYREALKLSPRHPQANCNLGNILNRQDRYAEAMPYFREVLKHAPAHAQALCGLGNALYMTGQVNDAVGLYRRALAARPGYTEAGFNLGTALAGQGQWEEAAARLRAVLETAPAHTDAMVNLGNVLLMQGRKDEAAEQYRAALRVDGTKADARKNLAVILAARKGPDGPAAATGPSKVVK